MGAAGPECQVFPMLVSLNLLCRWLIQLSPFTAVTDISLFLAV
jgi:hypothetical protein